MVRKKTKRKPKLTGVSCTAGNYDSFGNTIDYFTVSFRVPRDKLPEALKTLYQNTALEDIEGVAITEPEKELDYEPDYYD